MSLIVQYETRLRRLATGVESTPGRWLVALRWAAITGMTATIVVGKLVAPALRLSPLIGLLVGLAVLNLGWLWLEASGLVRRAVTLGAQIAVDLLALGLVLWYSGGLENPFAPFLTFQVVLAGLLTSSRVTIFTAALAVSVAAALDRAPPLDLHGAAMEPDHLRALGRLFAIVALGLFLGFFVWLYARRLERLVEQTAQSEKLAALGRTLAAMCHELNTPLGTIVLAGTELEELGSAAGSSEITILARAVRQSGARANEIITLLRGVVRPDLKLEPVALGSFCEEYVALELDRLGYRGRRALRVLSPITLPLVPTALRQIVTNLLANAVDALARTPDPAISVEVEPREGGVDVRFIDNGPGVDPRILPRLGEPFQTTKPTGTGLGLYVSSLLAERMGGRLALDSRGGEGARLTLSFEIAEERP